MSITGEIIQIFIASPGDVATERNIAESVIHAWNSKHAKERKMILLSQRWEIDATPDLDGDPQEVINRQLVDNCDILIGIFWTRLGTPTSRGESGTAEEIERFRTSGKRCMVYFSNKPVNPSDFDTVEYDRVKKYKQTLKSGFTGSFSDTDKFKEKLITDLERAIHEFIRNETNNPGISQRENQSNNQVLQFQPILNENNIVRRIPMILSRGGTNALDFVVDSALYIAYPKHQYKDDIKKKILAHKSIDTKYLYCTEEGCRQWIDSCKQPQYKFYNNSVNNLQQNISKIVDEINKVVVGREIDLISLGSGNGIKDKIILTELCGRINENQKIYYYPIDISDSMIIETIRNSMQNNDFLKKKVSIKAIVGDMTDLRPLEYIYEERPLNNLFSILGNTIGNTNEKEIIDSLSHAMFEGDLVLIEINVDQISLESEDNFYKDELSMRRHFVPLESLGVPFEKDKMRYKIITSPSSSSMILNTKTLEVSYKKASIDGNICTDIRLATVHHYDLESFKKAIEDKLHVKTIFSSEAQGVGLILARRQYDMRISS
jgi:Histidine-specific methyltransferase, SAM-dependent/Domain of unknown function (DUF4062)